MEIQFSQSDIETLLFVLRQTIQELQAMSQVLEIQERIQILYDTQVVFESELESQSHLDASR